MTSEIFLGEGEVPCHADRCSRPYSCSRRFHYEKKTAQPTKYGRGGVARRSLLPVNGHGC